MIRLLLKFLINAFIFKSVSFGNHQNPLLNDRDPPCFFNPLCVCSKAYPDLGRVTCRDIPLLNIPHQINVSKLFVLHLENNGLRHVQPYFFSKTGLLKIEITRNLLREIDEESFAGLERSLWELNLRGNKFRQIPNRSLKYLRKLRLLDLSDNEITSLRPEDWMGMEESLKTLILSGNKLFNLRPKTFSTLHKLEILDLSRNLLLDLDFLAFKGGSIQLNELNLAGNLLAEIPLDLLSELRELRTLDLSFNRISEIKGHSVKGKSTNFSLDTLRLDHNQIGHLPALSFQYFSELNRTYLNGNPITSVQKQAFEGSKIREVYMADCEISELTADTFNGLQSHLEVLNLESNNLTEIPNHNFKGFNLLKRLNLKNNFIQELNFDQWFEGDRFPLEILDVSGQSVYRVSFQGWNKLSNLRSLTLSNFPGSSLSSNDFPEYFKQLEEIKISFSNIKIIKSHAFQNVRGLRKLDLSENLISKLEVEAFSEIMYSLVFLSLAHGLKPTLTQLPANIFENFTSLEILDLSNNGLRIIPQKLFHSMKRLKIIFLQDNFVEFISKSVFQGQIHTDLRAIHLSFNQLSVIESQTFRDLNNLERLWLNDNRINKINKKAFVNLNRLRYLYLRGNQISYLAEESFQDLPELEKLDLAFNRLKSFNYACLDQVGTFSSVVLNVSFNQIEQVYLNESAFDHSNLIPEQVNIKTLDLSHNNISQLAPNIFKPIESSATHLYLSHNKLQNISKNVFGGLKHLHCLDVSYNRLYEVEEESFLNTTSIQILYLSNNYLSEIPKLTFNDIRQLRIVDLSGNSLKSLKENLFKYGAMERLNLSKNQLNKVPIFSFHGDSGKTLLELDLSKNLIVSLPSPDAFGKFRNLRYLNLSKNRILRIDDKTFSHLRRLITLDLSHNIDLSFDSRSQAFYGLEKSLKHLNLRNISLNAVPNFYLPSLEFLDVAKNSIFTLSFESTVNLTNLRLLELADNLMNALPPALNAFINLEYLGLSGNPFESLHLQQSFSLRELDLRYISLDVLERGALGKIPLLENLKVTVNQTPQDSNLPLMVKENSGLNRIEVEVPETGGFSAMNEMKGLFPPKLQTLILSGRGLKRLPKNLLKAVRNPRFHLILFNSSIEEIGADIFENAMNIRNLTLTFEFNKLRRFSYPNTGRLPNSAKKLFLSSLQLKNNDWICDCSIGWVEGWERKKRQYLCSDDLEECLISSDDLRLALCTDRGRRSLDEVFKSELECDWNSAGNFKASLLLEFSIINAALLYLSYI